MNCFRVIKIRQPVTCCECGKKLPKKSYAYGSDWTRICLKCGEEFNNEALKGYAEISKYIKLNQKRLKKNKDKWEVENSLALL